MPTVLVHFLPLKTQIHLLGSQPHARIFCTGRRVQVTFPINLFCPPQFQQPPDGPPTLTEVLFHNTTDFHTQKEDNLRTGCGACSEDNARSSSSSANGTRTGPRTPCFLRFWLFQVTENLFLFCLTSVCDGSHFGEVASH